MAYPTVTVSEMVSRVAYMLTNSATASANLSTEIKWALEDNLNTLAMAADLPAFRKEVTINAVADTTEYEMPVDFYRQIDPGLKFKENPLWTLECYDQQDFDRYDGDWRLQESSRPRFYTLRGRDEVSGRQLLRLKPKPDKTYALTLPYFSVPQRIATASDSDVLDRRFPPHVWLAVAQGAAVNFPQYLTDKQLVAYRQRFNDGAMQIQQTASPVTGRHYQNRRYRSNVGPRSTTWDMTGTDIVDSNGTSV